MAPVGLAVIERSIANLWILCIPGTMKRLLFYPLLTLLLVVGSVTAAPTVNGLRTDAVAMPDCYGAEARTLYAALAPAGGTLRTLNLADNWTSLIVLADDG